MAATNHEVFIPVAAGEELYEKLTKDLWNDAAAKKCIFITGTIGSGKTKTLLGYVERMLRTGIMRSALYVSPRNALCSQAASILEDIHGRELSAPGVVGGDQMKARLVVRRYYTGGNEDNYRDRNGDLYATMKDVPSESATVDFCVINSVSRLSPTTPYDVIIIDESVTTVEQCFMYHDGCRTVNGAFVTPGFVDDYVELIRRAHAVLFVDSAFTASNLDTCINMYSGAYRKASTKEIRAYVSGPPPNAKDRRRFVVAKSGLGGVKKLTDIKRYEVFDAGANGRLPIYEKIIEHGGCDGLLATLHRSAWSGEKSIVYCSTARLANRYADLIKSTRPHGVFGGPPQLRRCCPPIPYGPRRERR
jgi:hypothetical protein